MAYSDFTIERLEREFSLNIGEGQLFDLNRTIEPSEWLQKTLEKAERLGYSSEKERSERIVSPILTELSEINKNRFFIFSGRNLDASPDVGLAGECDFILALSPTRFLLKSPIFSIVEAKKEAIDKGLEQCLAQLVGAQLMNEKQGKPMKYLFGCSTSGDVWKFVKLTEQRVIFDIDEYYLNEPEKILGILQQIVEANNS